jgi:hypothetical protein
MRSRISRLATTLSTVAMMALAGGASVKGF